MDEPDKKTLIDFPSDFPIKIMGAHEAGFMPAITEIVQRHDGTFDVASIEARPSKSGNYLSLTCMVRAVSRQQLDALYRELTAHPLVKVVL